jgi:chromosome segregation ATPase
MELSSQQKDAANHRAKLQHSIDAAASDIVLLEKGLERHDTLSQELQQGQEATSTNLQSFTRSHEKISTDVRTLQHQLSKAQQSLLDTREGLDRTTELTNKIHTGLQETDTELHKTCLQLDEVAMKQGIIKEDLGKTSACVTDLVVGHRRAVNNVQTLQHELGKTNDTLHTTRGQIETTHAGLNGLKGDLGRTKETLDRVDRGMESCHQSFSGLRKGFQETGAHISTRPMTLPKLTQDRLAKVESRGSPGQVKSSPEGTKGMITAWGPRSPQDDETSTQCSDATARTGSRRDTMELQ